MKKLLSPSTLQYITRILIFELGLAIIVAAILFLRDRSLNAFGDWMFWSGLIILAVGASSLIGNWGITRSGLYQLGLTVSDQDVPSRIKAELKEEQSSFSFLQLCAGIGILAIVISSLL
jgi:steroid 5-alpha reductase family enzyme